LGLSFADLSEEGTQWGRNRIFSVSAGILEDVGEDDLDGRRIREDIK